MIESNRFPFKYFLLISLPIAVISASFTKNNFYHGLSLIFVLSSYLILPKKSFNFLGCSWLLINGWLILPASIQLILGDPNNELLHIDFVKTLAASTMYFFSAVLIVNTCKNVKDENLLMLYSVIFVMSVSFFILLYVSDYEFGQSFYGQKFNLRNGLFWSWSRVVGLVGLMIFFHTKVLERDNLNKVVSILIFFIIGYAVILFQSRTLLAYFILLYLPFIKKTLLNKKSYLLGFFALIAIFLLMENSTVMERFLNTFSSDQIQKESRLQLWIDFYNNLEFSNFIGSLNSPASITQERLESFHSVILDSFWYSGYVGLIIATINIYVCFRMFLATKNYSSKVTIFFVVLGLLIGAPPFSDLLTLNLLIPFLVVGLNFFSSTRASSQKAQS